MNILEIIIIVLTFGFALMGYRKGFVRKLASMLSLVLSVVLVSVFLPYMTEFLKNNTPVYEYIVDQCKQVMTEKLADSILSGNSQNAEAQTYQNMGRDQIKSLMEENGYDSSIVDSLTDEQLEQYKKQYIEQYAQQYLGGGQGENWQPDRIEQTELIEGLPVPDVLKDLLLDYNNQEGYSSLGVETFQDYVIQFIATVILNVVSFIAAVIVVQVFLWLAIAALDILSHIPLIGGLNRLLGLLLGLIQALFFLWIFFLILSMTSTTEIGLQLMSMVQSSRLLGYLYDSNLFMQIVLQAAAIFI